jgi:hypothetical protein
MPLLAAAALATMRWHIHFSRVGIEPVLVPLFLTLILWALWRARRTNSPAAWLALGVVVGLTPYTYPAGRLLPVVAAVLAAWNLLFHPPAPFPEAKRHVPGEGERGGRIYGLGEASGKNKASKRPLTQAKRRCSK